MKKLLIALPLVAGASWAGTTYYSSAQALPEYQQLLAALNTHVVQTLPVRFVEADYEAGFMESRATTNLVYSTLGETKVILQFDHAISHSPVVIDEHGARVGESYIVTTAKLDNIDPEIRDQVAQVFGGADPLTIYTSAGLSGDIRNNILISPIQFEDDDITISYTGANFTIDMPTAQQYIGFGSLGSAEFRSVDQPQVVSISETQMTFDYRLLNDALYIGTSEFTLPSISATSPLQDELHIQGVRMLSASEQATDETIDSHARFEIAAIDSASVPFTHFRFDATANHANIEALTRLANFQKTVFETIYSGSPLTEEDIETIQSLENALSPYLNALTAGLEMELDIEAGTDEGPIKASASVRFEENVRDADTPRELLTPIVASATFTTSEAAISQIPPAAMMMQQFVGEFIVQEGENYSFDARLENLNAELNGEAVPLEAMLADELDQPLEGFIDKDNAS